MFLKSIAFKNFRNHRNLTLFFDKKINLIVGDNGSGKTNILEAIHLLSIGKSFRTNSLEDLIHHGQSYFHLEAEFIKEDTSQYLKIGYDKNKKKIEHNSTALRSFSELLGILPSVLYAPKDISLITSGPLERRKFLNVYLSQKDKNYLFHLIRYSKALEQRNALLKRGSFQEAEISSFEKQLALSGFYLIEQRISAATFLQNKISSFVKELIHKEESFEIQYIHSFEALKELHVEAMGEFYKKQRPKELAYKTTLVGPHREDFSILLNNRLVKSFCSEGQKRSFLHALKLSEWTLLAEKERAAPLMCIDDIGIHLDPSRNSLLQKSLTSLNQVFITTPQSDLLFHQAEDMKVIKL